MKNEKINNKNNMQLELTTKLRVLYSYLKSNNFDNIIFDMGNSIHPVALASNSFPRNDLGDVITSDKNTDSFTEEEGELILDTFRNAFKEKPSTLQKFFGFDSTNSKINMFIGYNCFDNVEYDLLSFDQATGKSMQRPYDYDWRTSDHLGGKTAILYASSRKKFFESRIYTCQIFDLNINYRGGSQLVIDTKTPLDIPKLLSKEYEESITTDKLL